MVENLSSFEPVEIVRSLEALIGREDVSEDYIRFRIELLKAQTAVRDALAHFVRLPPSRVADGKRKGEPSEIDPSEVPFDRALAETFLEDLSKALAKYGRNEDLTRLAVAAAEAPELLEQLAHKAAFGPDETFLTSLSNRLEVGFEALLFFGRVLAAPFVTEAVRRRKQRALPPPKTSACCPWCGSFPGLAKLKREEGEEGKRVLCCSLCGETWEFARLECPFCQNQAALGRLSVGTDPCSIETCDGCKRYLKTVDERKLPEDEAVVPLVVTNATLYLDLIAQEEGYASGPPYGALQ